MAEINWMTGGKQGSGIDSALEVFSRIMMRHGYYVFGYREYFSNIKGMHSFFIARVSDSPKTTMSSLVDIAIFFDNESVLGEKNTRGETVHEGHVKDMKSGGVLIIDSKTDASKITRKDIKVIQIDFDEIVSEAAKKLGLRASDAVITKNIICVTASTFMLGLQVGEIEEAIKDVFSKKSEKIVTMNITVSDLTIEYLKKKNLQPIFSLKPLDKKELLYMQGFAATAIGKAIAGCKMQVYYPITPASDESEFIEAHPELGIRVIQPESELAVAAMTTGASLAGARASTSTSGPGLSLMTETVTWAGMTETPLVIVDHQRGSPATGQPTRTEQGDLMFSVHQGHGDFGRIVLAPGNVPESIKITAMAFNYAEKYQLPVIVLGEKAISQVSLSLEKAEIDRIMQEYKIDRGKLVEQGGKDYKRYLFTTDGISPRIKLGDPTSIMWTTGDEHEEFGHISEETTNRNKMMEKRNGKMKAILKDLTQEEKFGLFGRLESADILLVSWGGPSEAIKEALDVNAAFLQIRLIEPFPLEAVEIMKKAKKLVCIEQNISGQLRQHIASSCGLMIENQILKYNGRPMRYDELKEGIARIMKGEKKVILNAY
ncbi:2-oxoacid:acceptor oxidoreductase subunit alpha [Candidatus Parvarchaeota archaeon]|nr:2-oxoacid:acceptor oxidoreductase subunit alpha [Candidatus Parvarchaeota archaeon]